MEAAHAHHHSPLHRLRVSIPGSRSDARSRDRTGRRHLTSRRCHNDAMTVHSFLPPLTGRLLSQPYRYTSSYTYRYTLCLCMRHLPLHHDYTAHFLTFPPSHVRALRARLPCCIPPFLSLIPAPSGGGPFRHGPRTD